MVVDKKRVDQSRVRLAEVEIGDETGIVSLRARDEQIDLLEEVSRRSGAVVLRNCTLELYQGKHIRLAVTKWGKLSVYPDNVASTPPSPSKMNFDRNFSAIDLSVVASEMVDTQSESTYSGRAAKQSEALESGSRVSIPKGGGHNMQKQQQQQHSSARRGGRDKKQPKNKGGMASTNQPPYGSPSGSTVPSQPTPMRYTTMHPYPMYDQGMDLRQYHYQRPQEAVLAPASAQHMMMQRQYELQQRQIQQMYHNQQERHRAGVSPSHQPAGMQYHQVVPAGSFDTGDYHTYASTASSPILIPMAMSGTHGSSNINPRLHTSDPRQGDAHDSSIGAHDAHATQYMSVSPDDSSQFSQKMNPDATAFAPSYMGAAPGECDEALAHRPSWTLPLTLCCFLQLIQLPHTNYISLMIPPTPQQSAVPILTSMYTLVGWCIRKLLEGLILVLRRAKLACAIRHHRAVRKTRVASPQERRTHKVWSWETQATKYPLSGSRNRGSTILNPMPHRQHRRRHNTLAIEIETDCRRSGDTATKNHTRCQDTVFFFTSVPAPRVHT